MQIIEKNWRLLLASAAATAVMVAAPVSIDSFSEKGVVSFSLSAAQAKDGDDDSDSRSGSSGRSARSDDDDDGGKGRGRGRGRGGDDDRDDRDDDDDDHDDDHDDDDDDDKDDDDDRGHRESRPRNLMHYLIGNRDLGTIAKAEAEGDSLEVTYGDGWKEEIEEGRYELKNPANRTVVERPATQADFDRLSSAF